MLAACEPCVRHNTLVLSIATNPEYLAQVQEMAESAASVGYPCVCAAASSGLHAAGSSSSLVRLLHLPLSSEWRPPQMWCAKQLAGWRHAGILKTHALSVALSRGWHVLLMDADWRFVADPLPALLASNRDVIGARDQTRHMLNVGALLVCSTPELARVSLRVLNRTLSAWDQAVITEEVAASTASCCWADLGGKGYIRHPAVSREAKLRTRGRHQECSSGAEASSLGDGVRLRPPLATADVTGLPSRRMYRFWNGAPAAYNSIERAFYRFKCYECDGKCTREKCELGEAAGRRLQGNATADAQLGHT